VVLGGPSAYPDPGTIGEPVDHQAKVRTDANGFVVESEFGLWNASLDNGSVPVSKLDNVVVYVVMNDFRDVSANDSDLRGV
jgi:hypothetical protein